jgi:hypothetical protein
MAAAAHGGAAAPAATVEAVLMNLGCRLKSSWCVRRASRGDMTLLKLAQITALTPMGRFNMHNLLA